MTQTIPEPSFELSLPSQTLQIEDLPILQTLGQIHGNTLMLERGLKGYRLKKTVDVDLEKLLSISEKGVCEYILKSLVSQRPSLIPWVLQNQSVIALARYLLRSRSGSLMGFYGYSNTVSLYSRRLKTSPDSIIADVKADEIRVDPDRLVKHRGFIEKCIAEMQDRTPPVSSGRISGYVRQIRTWYKCSDVEIPKPQMPRVRVVRKDRAPTPEELQIVFDIADLRGKLIVALLALGGFREGTLSQLRYSQIRQDFENGKLPLHVHVSEEITKGKYGDYDTFLSEEVVDYIRLYLEMRQRGTPPQLKAGEQVDYMPPEELTDDSPLVRDSLSPRPRPIGEKQIYKLVHSLYQRAGLLKQGRNGGFDLRPHSLRKFFKTQMKSRGVDSDYVDYMMGHVVDTYHDIQSKGVEFLRDIYSKAGLTIRPQTKLGKLDVLKEFARGLGMDPEKILVKEAFAEPQMIYLDPAQQQAQQVQQLSKALMRRFMEEASTASNLSNLR